MVFESYFLRLKSKRVQTATTNYNRWHVSRLQAEEKERERESSRQVLF